MKLDLPPIPWAADKFVDAGGGRSIRAADGGVVLRVHSGNAWAGKDGSGFRSEAERDAVVAAILEWVNREAQ